METPHINAKHLQSSNSYVTMYFHWNWVLHDVFLLFLSFFGKKCCYLKSSCWWWYGINNAMFSNDKNTREYYMKVRKWKMTWKAKRRKFLSEFVQHQKLGYITHSPQVFRARINWKKVNNCILSDSIQGIWWRVWHFPCGKGRINSFEASAERQHPFSLFSICRLF